MLKLIYTESKTKMFLALVFFSLLYSQFSYSQQAPPDGAGRTTWKQVRDDEKSSKKNYKEHHKRIQNKDTRKEMKQNKKKAKKENLGIKKPSRSDRSKYKKQKKQANKSKRKRQSGSDKKKGKYVKQGKKSKKMKKGQKKARHKGNMKKLISTKNPEYFSAFIFFFDFRGEKNDF